MRRGQSNPRCQASLEGPGWSVGEEEEAGPFFRFKFALRFSSLADRSRLVPESIEKCALLAPRLKTERMVAENTGKAESGRGGVGGGADLAVGGERLEQEERMAG